MTAPQRRARTPARAGRYVSQPVGYDAFYPAPYPPPDLALDRRLLDLLLRRGPRTRASRGRVRDPAEPRPLRPDVRATGGGALESDRRHAGIADGRAGV